MSYPTIQDVARAANVSTATVSRALSLPERVSDSTRQRVLNAIEETGYAINQTARNLRRQTTGAIVVLVPNLGNPFFSRILAGIEGAASKAGYTILICDTKVAHRDVALHEAFVRNNRADGLIVLDGSIGEMFRTSGRRRPAVVYACEWRDGTGLPSVRFDNEGGARLAVDHLLRLGHRRIGHVTGPFENVLTRARFDGFAAAMAHAGLPIRKDWLFAGDFTLEAGVRAAAEWMALTDRPEAVFLANDEMACGFISELHRRGVGVPRDLSVVGFDDIDIAAHYIPALTTIHQPRHEIGEAAFAELTRVMTAGEPRTGNTKPRWLEATLIVRESTRPC